MTEAHSSANSHEHAPRRAEPTGASDLDSPGNASSADVAMLSDVAPAQPLGRVLGTLSQAGAQAPRRVLNYQRAVGNQVVQRLLAERPAAAAPVVQRKYLVPPYSEPSIDFNGLAYADLRAQIETYKSAPGARTNIKQQRLNKLIGVVNGFLSGRLSAPAMRNFEVLRQEILSEQARIDSAGATPTPSPTPIPTPTPTPVPTPTPNPTPSPTPIRTPTLTPSPTPNPTPSPTPNPTPSPTPNPTPSPTPIRTPTPTPGSSPQSPSGATATLTPTPVPTPTPAPIRTPTPTASVTPIQADPRLLAAEQAQLGVEQMIIAPRVTWTEVATGDRYSSQSPRAGRRVRTETITRYELASGAGIKRLPLQYRVAGGAPIVNVSAGSNHTVPTAGWTVNRADVRLGDQPEVRASNVWYRLKDATHLSEVTANTTDVWKLAAEDVRAAGREVRSAGTWYQLATPSDLTSHNTTYDVIKLDGKDVRVVSTPENVSTASVGFKDLPHEQPLFPATPSGADIKQLGLGDCYLQALLINIAEQNPAHLSNMMRDNADGTVTVRFYTVDETTPTAPVYAPEEIRINKSLPDTATGQALYQGGAPWARILQKAFAAYAQLHGQYGGAYDSSKGAGYAQIASGMTYKLYGVFYGPARVTAGFDRTSYDPSATSATNLQANAGVIKKLLQFAGQDRTLVSAGQVMSLTVGASLKAHVERAAGVIGRIVPTSVPSDQRTTWDRMVYNLPIVVRNLNDPRNARLDPTRVAGMNTVVSDADTLAVGLKTWATTNQHDPDISAAFELLNDIKEAGTDTSEGQRFSYSGHAYSIVRITFHPTTPDPASLTPTVLAGINMETTQIKLRNPHGKNSPNAYNAPQNDTGEFDLTLAQFLRNFSEVEYGLVRATT